MTTIIALLMVFGTLFLVVFCNALFGGFATICVMLFFGTILLVHSSD
jgi:hypothetical protein